MTTILNKSGSPEWSVNNLDKFPLFIQKAILMDYPQLLSEEQKREISNSEEAVKANFLQDLKKVDYPEDFEKFPEKIQKRIVVKQLAEKKLKEIKLKKATRISTSQHLKDKFQNELKISSDK